MYVQDVEKPIWFESISINYFLWMAESFNWPSIIWSSVVSHEHPISRVQGVQFQPNPGWFRWFYITIIPLRLYHVSGLSWSITLFRLLTWLTITYGGLFIFFLKDFRSSPKKLGMISLKKQLQLASQGPSAALLVPWVPLPVAEQRNFRCGVTWRHCLEVAVCWECDDGTHKISGIPSG